jgi:hypothetical protein
LALAVAAAVASWTSAAEVKPLLAHIKAVGTRGAGNVRAARAWRQLTRGGPEVHLDTLAALDDANPTAANWLRSVVETIVDRSLANSQPLPAAKLEAFVRDTRHAGRARRLAYDCLTRVDKTAPKRLLPGMLNDPGKELRREAVAVALRAADQLFNKKDKPAATAAYRKLLDAARDRDQVEHVAKRLNELGVKTDLTRQFGFITRWRLIGPFDHTGGIGFKKAYPPEQKVDLTAVQEGKKKQRLRWIEHQTALPYGLVDLNKALGKNMGAVAYAFAAVTAPRRLPVHIRVGSNNAVKIFLNGKELFRREEYHHGTEMDQYVGSGVLRPGRNEILLKVCQNEQTDAWAQTWSFQLRVCDTIGGPVPIKLVTAKNKE